MFDDQGEYVLGRGESADWRLTYSGVSRQHARLAFARGSWRLFDLASKNGTQLNGRPIDSAVIDGDAWLNLGGAPVLLEIVDEPAAKRERLADAERTAQARGFIDKFSPERDTAAFLQSCLAGIVETAAADRGGIWFADTEGEPRIIARLGPEKPAESLSTIRHVLQSGAAIISHDVEGVEALATRQSIMLGGVRALICLPLAKADGPRGAVYADSKTPGRFFSELDVGLLQGLADHAVLALAAADLRREIAKLSR